jgi:predicted  nucleic acid-binding Zn-ribbon protein
VNRELTQVTEIRTLQEIDNEAEGHRAALDEVERRLAASEVLDSARERLAGAETELAAVKREQRKVEGDIEGLSARIAPEEKRLYDGSVRNPKELASIQHEVELLREQRTKLEDQLLEVMQRLEAAETEHVAARSDATRAEEARDRELTDLTAQSVRLKDAIAAVEVKRDAQLPKILPRNLKTYQDVRKRRGSAAVSRINGGNCGGCRVSIPEAVRRKAFTADELAQCPNCASILYVG